MTPSVRATAQRPLHRAEATLYVLAGAVAGGLPVLYVRELLRALAWVAG